MSDLIPADLQAEVNRLVLLSAFVSAAMDARNALRDELAVRMPNGTKVTGRHPNGDTLGTVSIADPDPEAFVTDRAALDAWIREQHPGELETIHDFGDPAEVAAVLAEYAPHLLVEVKVIPEELRARVVKAAATQPVPGTDRVRPNGRMTVRPGKAATELVRAALAGTTALELEAGQ